MFPLTEPRLNHCIGCGCAEFTIAPTLQRSVRLLRCLACGIAQTDPQPTVEELELHYSQSYYGPENAKFFPSIEKVVKWKSTRRARWIDRQLQGRSKILEIGCGRGLLLQALARLGHECQGTERSELAAARARKIPGIRVHAQPLRACGFQAGTFDAAVLWHVLEHLYRPDEMLSELHGLLKPAGRLILEVPNYSSFQARLSGRFWFHLDFERHLFHFTRPGLIRMLETLGFDTIAVGTFSLEQSPFGALQSFLNSFRLEPEIFYKILKREVSLPLSARFFHYSLAAALLLPAAAFASGESLLSRGGILRLVAQKK